MMKDAEAVFADIPRISAAHGHDFDQVIVMGRSPGSAAAIHLASLHSSSLAGLTLDSPYADGLALIARLGGPTISRSELSDWADNSDKMRQCHLPTLIIHGADDRIIPVTDAKALLERCPSKAKHLLEVKGAGHNNLLFRGLSQYCRELRNHIVRTKP